MKEYDTSRLDRLRVKRKPVMHTQRLLVGHDYLANETWVNYSSQVDMSGLALVLAKRQLANDGVELPDRALHNVFYMDDGYVVTFVWTEWEEVDEDESEVTH